MNKSKREQPTSEEMDTLFENAKNPYPSELRVDVPRNDLPFYKSFSLPSMEVPIEIRKLKYSEIRQLHNIDRDNSNEVYDKLLLACTNLTLQSIELMPLLERKYLLLYIRSISFVDNKITIENDCEADDCDRNRDIDIDIAELEFESAPPEFFEDKIIAVGNDEYVVKYCEELYRDDKILSHMNYEDDAEEDISNAVAVVESVSLNGDNIYNHPSEFSEYLVAVEFFNDHGHLTQWILEDLVKYDYGIKTLERHWSCKCGHKNKTEIDSDTFFFLADI